MMKGEEVSITINSEKILQLNNFLLREISKIVKGKAIDLATSEKEIVEKDKPWSNIHGDLLSLIRTRLFAGDVIAFLSVCKWWWKSVPVIHTRYFQLPISSSECQTPCLFSNSRILHPIYNERLSIDFVLEKGTRIRVVKDDWLLISGCEWGSLFFLNFFTKTKIDLPNVRASTCAISFNSSPTSTEWQIVVGTLDGSGEIAIWSIKCGEEEWNCFNHPKRFDFSSCNPVIHKGSYYFLDRNAKVLVYNQKKRKLRFHNASRGISQKISMAGSEQYLLENKQGKLMAVFVSLGGSWIQVCQWDDYKKTWERVRSLGNKMLFVSRPLSLCEESTVRGAGNKIYLPRFVGDRYLFYSLLTKQYHTFESGSSYKDFNNESKFLVNSTWIKPYS